MKTVLFTDLDGTLLTEKYRFDETKPAITYLLAKNVAIVFCSSKTRLEIEFYRKQMGVCDPFISENGAAIYIPHSYFQHNYIYTRQTEDCNAIELGIPYVKLRQSIKKIAAKTGAKIVGFGDMTAQEIAQDAGLNFELARLAKQREFDEPFRIAEGNEKQVFAEIRNEGLGVTKGDGYYHLSGNHDKGSAVTLLNKLYVENFGRTRTMAVGNSQNDLSMLKVADMSFFVEKTGDLGSVWKRIAACVT